MKTTIDIADGLLEQARRSARKQGTTLRALVEEGLRRILKEEKTGSGFRLRDASFRGEGLAEEFRDADWERIREAAYGDRGG